MSSNIDATKPVEGSASTANVRDNFDAAKTEINGLHRATLDSVTSTGTVNALIASFSEVPTIAEGLTVTVKATGANTTTTPTLKVNTDTAKTIVKESGSALVSGDIAGSRHYCTFRYDAANTVWVLLNPAVNLNLASAWPVGSIYMNAGVATDPATLLGFGTWATFGAGKVLVGLDSGDVDFDTLEETGGSKDATGTSDSHVLTEAEIPAHTHTINSGGSDGSGTNSVDQATNIAETKTTNSTGGGGGHTHGISLTDASLQPYIVVHMWKRTA